MELGIGMLIAMTPFFVWIIAEARKDLKERKIRLTQKETKY